MAKKKGNVIGGWAFLIGVVLALIIGLGFTGTYQATATWILVIIGLVVGLLNIADEEASPFLMSATVLVIVSALGGGALSGVAYLGTILQALLVLFVPATIVVDIRNVFQLAKH